MTTFLSGTGKINETSPFKDGQPHIAFDTLRNGKGDTYTVKCRISTPTDLMNVALAVETLKNKRYKIDLVIYYMWGRMDRRIDDKKPYTLKALCGIINSFECETVSVYCPHSQATSDLLRNYVPFSQIEEDTFYDVGILNSIIHINGLTEVNQNVKDQIRSAINISLVYPDAGAAKRFSKSMLYDWYPNVSSVIMHKVRSEETGHLTDAKIVDGLVREDCVIIDDLCDGGATFIGASKALRASGAKSVSLVVPHGIFSKGYPIEGIDYIYTSNSYKEWEPSKGFGVRQYV